MEQKVFVRVRKLDLFAQDRRVIGLKRQTVAHLNQVSLRLDQVVLQHARFSDHLEQEQHGCLGVDQHQTGNSP